MNPTVNKEKWSEKEDLLLMKKVKSDGLKWSDIAKYFKGCRTEHMVKNRYNSLINNYRKSNKNNINSQSNRKIEDSIIKELKMNKVKSQLKPEDSMLN